MSSCTNPKSFWDFVRKNKKLINLPSAVKLDRISSVNRTIIFLSFELHFSFEDVNIDIISLGELPYALSSSCKINLSNIEFGRAKLHLVKSVSPDGLLGYFIFNLRSVLCLSLFLV